jgi:hypothetical protein
MASAGYSKRTLVQKLGIKPGFRVAFVNEPDHYRALLGDLPEGLQFGMEDGEPFDFLHLFATHQRQLERDFPAAKARMKMDGMLWVSWPKLKSKLESDLKEGIVRQIGLANELVDVKVAAVDDDWSGLKFVYRLEDRR